MNRGQTLKHPEVGVNYCPSDLQLWRTRFHRTSMHESGVLVHTEILQFAFLLIKSATGGSQNRRSIPVINLKIGKTPARWAAWR